MKVGDKYNLQTPKYGKRLPKCLRTGRNNKRKHDRKRNEEEQTGRLKEDRCEKVPEIYVPPEREEGNFKGYPFFVTAVLGTR